MSIIIIITVCLMCAVVMCVRGITRCVTCVVV